MSLFKFLDDFCFDFTLCLSFVITSCISDQLVEQPKVLFFLLKHQYTTCARHQYTTFASFPLIRLYISTIFSFQESRIKNMIHELGLHKKNSKSLFFFFFLALDYILFLL
ncbi:hypothetical protein Scep_023613 [Stephania cephalantha]|uniref:Uncharacterized protein n=1 Tax=Stephania cephalantha TaxID=152367 RepID=A0AAP0HSY3_9MAGN